MIHETLICTHLKQYYPIINLRPFLNSYAHHGFYYFEGNSSVDGRRVFIKVDGTFGEAAWREATIIKQLDSRHFPRLIAFEANGPYSFVIMEWIEGIPLEAVLKNRIHLSRQQKQNLFKQLLAILRTLHHSEIVHRDIRPANIMINMFEEEWKIVLFDFAFSIRKGSEPWPELDFFNTRRDLLIDLGGAEYKPHPFVWDDAYSICQVARKIDADYERKFPEVWNQMRSLVGTLTHIHKS